MEEVVAVKPVTRINAKYRLGTVFFQMPFIQAVLVTAVAMLLPLFGGTFYSFAYLLVFFWALRGPKYSLQALTLSWLLTYLNPGIYGYSESSAALRWLVLFGAAATVHLAAFRARLRFPAALLFLGFFGVFALVTSVLQSPFPDVSVFKIVSFLLGVSTIILGFWVSRVKPDEWGAWLKGFFASIIIVSSPLIFSGVGFFRNDRGFQGITNQPQVFGVFLAPVVAYLFAEIFLERRRSLWNILFFLLSIVFLFSTQARTGVLGALIGIVGGMAHWAISRKQLRRITYRWKSVLGSLCIIIIGALILAVNYEHLANRVERLVFKTSSAESLQEALLTSRGFLIDASMENFRQSPVIGIGFGISSDLSDKNVVREPFLGLPIGGAVEKGFSIIAVLEETGVVGTALLSIFILIILSSIFAAPKIFTASSVALAALGTTFGEGILFAIGGTGVLVWIIVGYSYFCALRVN